MVVFSFITTRTQQMLHQLTESVSCLSVAFGLSLVGSKVHAHGARSMNMPNTMSGEGGGGGGGGGGGSCLYS